MDSHTQNKTDLGELGGQLVNSLPEVPQITRPMIFSGPMVRAILEDRKTQTRRIVKPQPLTWDWPETKPNTRPELLATCPYGVAGDRLWVRETWMPDPPRDGTWCSVAWEDEMRINGIPEQFRKPEHVIYKSTWTGSEMVGWKPSIHMPRWASRITLEIIKGRVERLQDISEQDAKAEGVTFFPVISHATGYRYAYQKLWESLHGKGAWEKNPWCWVIEFCRVGNENHLAAPSSQNPTE